MKGSMKRWMSKHRTWGKIFLSVPLCSFYTLFMAVLAAPLWLVLVLNGLIVISASLNANRYGIKIVQDAMRVSKETCDPYPVLKEAQEQLTYGHKGFILQTIQVLYGVNLAEAGEFQKAREILSNIHIDKYVDIRPDFKTMYYANLSAVLFELGEAEEGEIWHQKAVQMYAYLPENKQKLQLTQDMELSIAAFRRRKGEYALVQKSLQTLHYENLYGRVKAAWICAKCCMELGDVLGARQNLQFAASHGNRLYIAAEARKQLEQLD